MKEKQQSLQQSVLDNLRVRQTPVAIFLQNAVKLQGYIADFDDYSILLVRDGLPQLVYKHTISTVLPQAPLRLRGTPATQSEDASADLPGQAINY